MTRGWRGSEAMACAWQETSPLGAEASACVVRAPLPSHGACTC